MVSANVIIENQAGLHGREATFFVQKANELKSTIYVEKGEGDNARRVLAKNLLGILSLGIVGGQTITIYVVGPNEEADLQEMKKLVETNFKEYNQHLKK